MELHKSLVDLAYVTYYWKIKYTVHFTIKKLLQYGDQTACTHIHLL